MLLSARAGVALGLWLAAAAGLCAQPPDAPLATPSPSRDSPVTWGGEVEVVSQYVWRGLTYSEGLVVWPSAWVSARGFTASLFLNHDRDATPAWTECDVAFGYERSIGRLTLGGSYLRYLYFEGDRTDVTGEIIARTDIAAGPGTVYTTHAFDVESYRGSYYAEAGYGFERSLDNRSAVAADASIAFWSRFIDRYTRATDMPITRGRIGPLTLTISYRRAIAPRVAIRPQVSFVRIGDAIGRRTLKPPGITAGLALVVGG